MRRQRKGQTGANADLALKWGVAWSRANYLPMWLDGAGAGAGLLLAQPPTASAATARAMMVMIFIVLCVFPPFFASGQVAGMMRSVAFDARANCVAGVTAGSRSLRAAGLAE